jgi:hypothetical protein
MGKFRKSTSFSRAYKKASNFGHVSKSFGGKHFKVTIGTKGISTSVKIGNITYRPQSGKYTVNCGGGIKYTGRTNSRRSNSGSYYGNNTYYGTNSFSNYQTKVSVEPVYSYNKEIDSLMKTIESRLETYYFNMKEAAEYTKLHFSDDPSVDMMIRYFERDCVKVYKSVESGLNKVVRLYKYHQLTNEEIDIVTKMQNEVKEYREEFELKILVNLINKVKKDSRNKDLVFHLERQRDFVKVINDLIISTMDMMLGKQIAKSSNIEICDLVFKNTQELWNCEITNKYMRQAWAIYKKSNGKRAKFAGTTGKELLAYINR